MAAPGEGRAGRGRAAPGAGPAGGAREPALPATFGHGRRAGAGAAILSAMEGTSPVTSRDALRAVPHDGDRGQQQPVRHRVAALEGGDLAAVHHRSRHQQPGQEGARRGVERDDRVVEPEPAPGQREPRLEHALLGAEQQPVPRGAGVAAGRQPRALLVPRDPVDDAAGQWAVDLGVDAHGRAAVAAGHGGGAVAGAVRDAADHARRPEGLAVRSRPDRCGRHPEPGDGLARARPGGRELTLPARGGGGSGGRLLRRERRRLDVAGPLGDGHARRQEPVHGAVEHSGRPARGLRPC